MGAIEKCAQYVKTAYKLSSYTHTIHPSKYILHHKYITLCDKLPGPAVLDLPAYCPKKLETGRQGW